MAETIINVIDLEATCWERKPPKDEQQEIIEIGIVEANYKNKTINKKKSIYVRPTKSGISPFCKDLTGLHSQFLVEHGVPLWKAFSKLISEYNAYKRPYASWGAFDRKLLKSDFKEENIDFDYPFKYQEHINIKTLDMVSDGLTNEKGLKTALRRRNIEFEGEHHRGADDAYNAAKVLIDIFGG